ncbi:hypothetical protein [Streptomyces turgidiscabies]|uniref:Integral membrane protein n=1 Tax=Streptomyces turgidiscabies TaxID=85558 RepID=A0ABU0RJH1_9ACTN|nr:hypothetical protein [Streptomyces turgidiscabies]MDQ0932099.1 hypothetical protein [Streptomyces turgidiscabies]
MSDRSLRLLTLPPQSVLLRERPASPPEAPSDKKNGDGQESTAQDDNPFAPPPEGTPDKPWQPRRPAGDDSSGDDGHSPWGSQWSDRQPGRSQGGFGDRSRRPGGPGGPEGQGDGQGTNPRWDPTDPAQRRARYALLCGMWAFFFALFSWAYVALLLGALALNWGISALRAKPATPNPDTPAPTQGTGGGGRQQRTAAISGLVTASLALVMVATTFTLQFVYRDYYTCANDALTATAKKDCADLLPKELRSVFGTNT